MVLFSAILEMPDGKLLDKQFTCPVLRRHYVVDTLPKLAPDARALKYLNHCFSITTEECDNIDVPPDDEAHWYACEVQWPDEIE